MNRIIILENDPSPKRGRVARKGQAVKTASTEDFPYTEKEVIEASYNAAKSVWSKYKAMFRNIEYTQDDFVQDAMMHSIKLYRNNYFSKSDKDTNDNLYNLLWTLLNGHFINNKIKSTRKELRTYYYEEPNTEDNTYSYNSSEHAYVGQLKAGDDDPSQVYLSEELVKAGRKIYMEMCDDLDVTSYGRDLNIEGEEPTLGTIRFNESTLAKLIGMGYSRKEVQELFGVTDLGHKQQIISRKYTAVTSRIRELILGMDKDDMEAVSAYIDYQESKAE